MIEFLFFMLIGLVIGIVSGKILIQKQKTKRNKVYESIMLEMEKKQRQVEIEKRNGTLTIERLDEIYYPKDQKEIK